jgi:hypothetical protein
VLSAVGDAVASSNRRACRDAIELRLDLTDARELDLQLLDELRHLCSERLGLGGLALKARTRVAPPVCSTRRSRWRGPSRRLRGVHAAGLSDLSCLTLCAGVSDAARSPAWASRGIRARTLSRSHAAQVRPGIVARKMWRSGRTEPRSRGKTERQSPAMHRAVQLFRQE